MTIKYRAASYDEFCDALSDAAWSQGNKGACVSGPRDSRDVALFLAEDGLSGFAMEGDYVGSVFAHATAKGRLAGILAQAKAAAVWAGHRRLTLDCFAPLDGVYARHGFVETGRAAFDWQFAPEHWTADLGEPDVVFMALPLFANDNAEGAEAEAA